jgi:hypothetical protein
MLVGDMHFTLDSVYVVDLRLDHETGGQALQCWWRAADSSAHTRCDTVSSWVS